MFQKNRFTQEMKLQLENVSKAMIEAMMQAGVTRCYTVPCDLVWLLKPMEDTPGFQLISVRHESSATFMADADARLTGKPAAVIVGRSVGATNASNGVDTARDASMPMLVLINDVDTSHQRFEAFQKMDLNAFYTPITKRVYAAQSTDSLPDLVADALRVSTQGRPGPVMLSIPTDLAGQVTPWSPRVVTGVRPTPAAATAEQVQRVAQRLASAQRPVILAGGGTRHCREALIAMAEKYSAGVYATFRRQDIFPNDHPLYLGHLGMYAPPPTLEALRNADLVLVLGSKLNQMTTQRFTLPLPETPVIQVDIDPARVGAFRAASIGVTAEIGGLLEQLLAQEVQPASRSWDAAHQKFLDATAVPADRATNGVDPAQVIKALAKAFPADTIMTSEAGGYATFLHQHWLFRHPNTQAAPTTGTMGYSVPAAVAAKLARPEQAAVALVGDGGFLMNGQEIETAVRMGLALTVVIFNNRSLSGGGYLENRRYTHITDVDYAAYARAFGATGLTVRNTAELDAAFQTAAAGKGVTVVDVKTDPAIATPGHAVRVSPT